MISLILPHASIQLLLSAGDCLHAATTAMWHKSYRQNALCAVPPIMAVLLSYDWHC